MCLFHWMLYIEYRVSPYVCTIETNRSAISLQCLCSLFLRWYDWSSPFSYHLFFPCIFFSTSFNTSDLSFFMYTAPSDIAVYTVPDVSPEVSSPLITLKIWRSFTSDIAYDYVFRKKGEGWKGMWYVICHHWSHSTLHSPLVCGTCMPHALMGD